MFLSKLYSWSNFRNFLGGVAEEQVERKQPRISEGISLVNSRSSILTLPPDVLTHMLSYLQPQEKVFLGQSHRSLHGMVERQIGECYQQAAKPRRWSLGLREYYTYHRLQLTYKNLREIDRWAPVIGNGLVLGSTASICGFILTRGPLNLNRKELLTVTYKSLRISTIISLFDGLCVFGGLLGTHWLLKLRGQYAEDGWQVQLSRAFLTEVMSDIWTFLNIYDIKRLYLKWVRDVYISSVFVSISRVLLNGRPSCYVFSSLLNALRIGYFYKPGFAKQLGASVMVHSLAALAALKDSCLEVAHKRLLTKDNLEAAYHYNLYGYLPLSPPMCKINATIHRELMTVMTRETVGVEAMSRMQRKQEREFLESLANADLLDDAVFRFLPGFGPKLFFFSLLVSVIKTLHNLQDREENFNSCLYVILSLLMQSKDFRKRQRLLIYMAMHLRNVDNENVAELLGNLRYFNQANPADPKNGDTLWHQVVQERNVWLASYLKDCGEVQDIPSLSSVHRGRTARDLVRALPDDGPDGVNSQLKELLDVV